MSSGRTALESLGSAAIGAQEVCHFCDGNGHMTMSLTCAQNACMVFAQTTMRSGRAIAGWPR